MFEVLANEEIAPQLHRMVVERAARGARPASPGQFVIVRVGEGGERIPLTIADADAEAGTITLIIQAVGRQHAGHRRHARRRRASATSPARWASRPRSSAGARWSASAAASARPCSSRWPRRWREAGNEVTTIIGGRSAPYVILQRRAGRVLATRCSCTTEDGSLGEQGLRHAPCWARCSTDAARRPGRRLRRRARCR